MTEIRMSNLSTLAHSADAASISDDAFSKSTPRHASAIVHFGPSNFHKTNQLPIYDRAGIGVDEVSTTGSNHSKNQFRALEAQGLNYTHTRYDPAGKKSVQMVGSISKLLDGRADPDAVFDAVANPKRQMATLTVTKNGYNVDFNKMQYKLQDADVQHDLQNPQAPHTAVGFLVEGLRRRRAANAGSFVVASLDNLKESGVTTRTACLSYARDGLKDEGLARWIDQNVKFPNSVVDCITPSTSDAIVARLAAENGVADATPVFSEDYNQLVMEDVLPEPLRGKLADAGVTFVDSIEASRQLKQLNLNASHAIMGAIGVLHGYQYTHHSANDPLIEGMLNDFMRYDVAPTLQGTDRATIAKYQQTTLARFKNTAIKDESQRIVTNGHSNICLYLADTIQSTLQSGGDTSRLALFMASFSQFLGGKDKDGFTYNIKETCFPAAHVAEARKPGAELLRTPQFAHLNLTQHPEFLAQYLKFRSELHAEFEKVEARGPQTYPDAVAAATGTDAPGMKQPVPQDTLQIALGVQGQPAILNGDLMQDIRQFSAPPVMSRRSTGSFDTDSLRSVLRTPALSLSGSMLGDFADPRRRLPKIHTSGSTTTLAGSDYSAMPSPLTKISGLWMTEMEPALAED